jgi:hypothetical protein
MAWLDKEMNGQTSLPYSYGPLSIDNDFLLHLEVLLQVSINNRSKIICFLCVEYGEGMGHGQVVRKLAKMLTFLKIP